MACAVITRRGWRSGRCLASSLCDATLFTAGRLCGWPSFQGGGNSTPSIFSTSDGRCFPRGPSLDRGEIEDRSFFFMMVYSRLP
jgi:hypothetical protein